MKVGDIVRWAGRRQAAPNIGIIESYCSFQNLWMVRFPDGRFEIESFLLEMISESG